MLKETKEDKIRNSTQGNLDQEMKWNSSQMSHQALHLNQFSRPRPTKLLKEWDLIEVEIFRKDITKWTMLDQPLILLNLSPKTVEIQDHLTNMLSIKGHEMRFKSHL
jgi:hypothetical protein